MSSIALKALRCAVVFTTGVLAGRGAEELTEARIEALFRPPLGERMTLSPDGRNLAYTRHEKAQLLLEIMDLDSLTRKARIAVGEDETTLNSPNEKRRSTLAFLEWADAHRLVFSPPAEVSPPSAVPDKEMLAALGIYVPPPQPIVFAMIGAVDADGSHLTDLLNIKDLQETIPEGPAGGALFTPTPAVLGFTDDDRTHVLLFNYGRVHEGIPARIRRLNLQTGKVSTVQEDLLSGVSQFRYGMDRSGRFRLASFPDGRNWRYEYRTDDPKKWWQKLPELTERGARVRFARLRVYRQLEEFFNLNLYNYNVKVGPTKEVR